MQFSAEGILYFFIIYNPLSFWITPYLSLKHPHPLENGEGRSDSFIGNFLIFPRWKGVIFKVFKYIPWENKVMRKCPVESISVALRHLINKPMLKLRPFHKRNVFLLKSLIHFCCSISKQFLKSKGFKVSYSSLSLSLQQSTHLTIVNTMSCHLKKVL